MVAGGCMGPGALNALPTRACGAVIESLDTSDDPLLSLLLLAERVTPPARLVRVDGASLVLAIK